MNISVVLRDNGTTYATEIGPKVADVVLK